MLSINCAISVQVYDVCPPLFLPPTPFFASLLFSSTITWRYEALVVSSQFSWIHNVVEWRKYITRQICRDRVTTRQGYGCPNKSMATPRPGLKSRAEKPRKERSWHFFFRESRLRQYKSTTTRKLSFASALSLSMTSVHVRLSVRCPFKPLNRKYGICAPDFEGRSGNASSVGQRNDLF